MLLLLHCEQFSTRGYHNTAWYALALLSWNIPCMTTLQWQPSSWICSYLHKGFFKFCFLIVSESSTPGSDLWFPRRCVSISLLLPVYVIVIESCSIKLGRMRGSLVTLQKLVQLFPSDTSFKNDLGVGYLLIGDNSNAKKIYEEVSFCSSQEKILFTFICSF